MIKTVIKIGGSLGQNPELPELMEMVSSLAREHEVLVIPGGGAFADAVRQYDRRFLLGDDTSHRMGIQAMDQFGCMIASMCLTGVLVKDLDDAKKNACAGRVPVLLCHDLICRADELPHSWDVTSDSIAAWVAARIKARQLILLKSVDGLFSGAGTLITNINLKQLESCRVVDHYFASGLERSGLDLWVVNGRYPHRLEQLLNKGVTKGSHLPGSGS